jgi:hypothetical protein
MLFGIVLFGYHIAFAALTVLRVIFTATLIPPPPHHAAMSRRLLLRAKLLNGFL